MSMFSIAFVEGARLRDGRLERIEVDHEKIDRRDAVRRHRGCMLRIVAHREQAAMHLRMQRLHPAVHHFRKAGELADVHDVSPASCSALAVPPVETISTPGPRAPARNRPGPPCRTPTAGRGRRGEDFRSCARSLSPAAIPARRRGGARRLCPASHARRSSARAAPGGRGRRPRSAACAAALPRRRDRRFLRVRRGPRARRNSTPRGSGSISIDAVAVAQAVGLDRGMQMKPHARIRPARPAATPAFGRHESVLAVEAAPCAKSA